MGCKRRVGGLTTTAVVALMSSTGASAQSHDINRLGSERNLGFIAGPHLTIPLGGQTQGRSQDKARFGLKISLTSDYAQSPFGYRSSTSVDLLDFGLHFDGSPNMQMNGQDIYTPLFTSAHANGDDNSGKTMLWVAGVGVLIVGGLVVINEIDDRLEDCFLTGSDDPKCN